MSRFSPITIGPGPAHLPLALGGSWYVPYGAPGDATAPLTAAIAAAYDGGIRHFDTAGAYGDGASEMLLGAFLRGKRDGVFLASKANPDDASAGTMARAVDDSLRRLRTDHIDLFYIHWPQSGVDMRPRMQALEAARAAGKIGAIGVSNFSTAQMRQVQEVGRIDAHQLGYNLIWRVAEHDLIPFCVSHGIAVVTYSTLAHGILTGKFGADPGLRPGDQRHAILPFRADLWPHVHAAVAAMAAVAAGLDRPLADLALRWALSRPGVTAVVAGASSAAQARANLAALQGDVPQDALDRLTAISTGLAAQMPAAGNLFNYHP